MFCRRFSSSFTREVPRTWKAKTHTERAERNKKTLKEDCSPHYYPHGTPKNQKKKQKHIKRSKKENWVAETRISVLCYFFLKKKRRRLLKSQESPWKWKTWKSNWRNKGKVWSNLQIRTTIKDWEYQGVCVGGKGFFENLVISFPLGDGQLMRMGTHKIRIPSSSPKSLGRLDRHSLLSCCSVHTSELPGIPLPDTLPKPQWHHLNIQT